MIHQHPGGLLLTKQMIDYCCFVPGAKVVDVGCGTGVTVEYLRNAWGLQAVGIDLAEVRLARGRDRVPGLPLIRAAGEQLPFTDASVDGVVAECSLSVMSNADKVLAEANRILITGGKLAFTDIYDLNPDSGLVSGSISGTEGFLGYLTRGEWSKLVEKNGFNITVWEDQSVFLKEFVASFIMEYGSAEDLCRCIVNKKNRELVCKQSQRKMKPGYFLLIAEKWRG